MVKLKKYLQNSSPIRKERKKMIIEELEKVNKKISELNKEFNDTPAGSRTDIMNELFKEQARYSGMTSMLSIIGYTVDDDWMDEIEEP